jgi:uncharacterized protein YerC
MMNSLQVTEEQRRQIKELYESGKTHEEIGNIIGASRRTIMKICLSMGLKKNHAEAQRSRIDPEFKEKVIELRNQGKTIHEIVVLTGRSISAVGRICSKSGIKLKFDLNGIKEKYEAGKTMDELAIEYHTSVYSIQKELHKIGATIRSMILPFNGISQKRDMPNLPNFEDNELWFRNAYEINKCIKVRLNVSVLLRRLLMRD